MVERYLTLAIKSFPRGHTMKIRYFIIPLISLLQILWLINKEEKNNQTFACYLKTEEF